MNIDIFKVEEWMNEYEKYSKYDLGNTTVNTMSLEELFAVTEENKDEFFKKLCSLKQGYGHIKGNPELKKSIAKLYKSVEEGHILTTIGAAGANHLVFYSLVEPSDRVISLIPTYQQLYSIPASFCSDTVVLKLKKENGFLPDLEELKDLITPNTKLICINNPNNPTGALIPQNMLEQIAQIADRAGAYILCDEVYRGLSPDEAKIPSMADIYEKGISVCSMSKTFSLAGLRLGWIACRDEEALESFTRHREYNMISCSVTDELLAALALKNTDKIIKRNCDAVRQSLEVLDEWVCTQKHFSYVKPQAGTTAMVYYDFDMPSEILCDKLAKEKGVFLTPGCCFEEEKCFRVGFCKSPDVLQQGLDKISEFVKENISMKE